MGKRGLRNVSSLWGKTLNMGDEKRRRGYYPPAAFPLLPPTEPIEQKGGSFFKSSSFSEAALQHLHDVLPRERNREALKRRKPVLLDVLCHGLEVRVVDAEFSKA